MGKAVATWGPVYCESKLKVGNVPPWERGMCHSGNWYQVCRRKAAITTMIKKRCDYSKFFVDLGQQTTIWLHTGGRVLYLCIIATELWVSISVACFNILRILSSDFLCIPEPFNVVSAEAVELNEISFVCSLEIDIPATSSEASTTEVSSCIGLGPPRWKF